MPRAGAVFGNSLTPPLIQTAQDTLPRVQGPCRTAFNNLHRHVPIFKHTYTSSQELTLEDTDAQMMLKSHS